MAIAGITFDVVEQILVRADVKDLIECKRVCKSWCSLISSHYFVKLQLNHSCNNDLKLRRHRRIARPIKNITAQYYRKYDIVGSCNALVCQEVDNRQLIVTNPLTAELKKVNLPSSILLHFYYNLYGFGYDPYIDDYKIIAVGVPVPSWTWTYPVPTSFHAFKLKATPAEPWRLIGKVNYEHTKNGRSGVLCDGALHWFMTSHESYRKVILSLDLSTEKFREIPQPKLSDEYECNDDHRLGVFQGCLCIYNYKSYSSNKWLHNNKQQSWELIPCDYEIKNVVHYLRTPGDYTQMDERFHGSICFSKSWAFIDAHIYVQSLVSPHADNTSNNNMWRRRQLTKKKVRPT